MTTDTIKHGETYSITVQPKDSAGDDLVMDGTWAAACRVTRVRLGGATLVDPVVTISGGSATFSVDTGDAEWEPGTYVWDVRVTDPAGDDFWTEERGLVLETRNAPAS